MIFQTDKIRKTLAVKDGKIVSVVLENKLTKDKTELVGDEFLIGYREKEKGKPEQNASLSSSMCTVREKGADTLVFHGKGTDGTEFQVTLRYSEKGGAIEKTLELKSDAEVFLDCVRQDVYRVPKGFSWSRVTPTKRVYVPCYIMTLGQPVYFSSFFTAYRSPVGDNKIEEGEFFLAYHPGRWLQKDFDGAYTLRPVVIGAAVQQGENACRTAFYDYVYSFSRKPTFYITFNSWYDFMLDIDTKCIESSFKEIHDGFQKSGLRDIDCYVVDDGWVDYRKKEFWGFIDKKFPNKFENESKLTKELGSKFGVWFGPRGGYTQCNRYGKIMKKLGYGHCLQSRDICTGHKDYIRDLGEKFMEFMREYNVEYFKLDGFANTPCKNRKHGHPVGGHDGIYFYTFLWEEWCEVFRKMKELNPNVFINLTSYAHCSPFFLEYVSAIWMNNAADMYYIGEGSDLDQCLNYRDERYHDLEKVRGLQLPSQFIYNHEPNYGVRNYNPPLPSRSHKTVRYTDAEFEKYLYGCMMRGSGFIELYYSPSLMKEGGKYAINAKVLKWAEENFDVISNAVYFGESPLKGEIYGYIGTDKDERKKAIVYFRNPSKEVKSTALPLSDYTFRSGSYRVSEHYPEQKSVGTFEGALSVTLKPKESKIFVIEYADEK